MPAKKVVNKKSPVASFEASLSELETLVEQMENGNLSLDETLQHFERGVQLTNLCQKALSEAEQKIETLHSKALSSLKSETIEEE